MTALPDTEPLRDPCDNDLQPLCALLLEEQYEPPPLSEEDSTLRRLFPSSVPSKPRRKRLDPPLNHQQRQRQRQQIEGHPDLAPEVLLLANKASKLCNILFTAEVVASILYAAILVFFLVDVFYDTSRASSTGGIDPLALLVLATVQFGFGAIWGLSFFCHYGLTVVHLRNVHARHYQSIHRFWRVSLAFGSVLFILAVVVYAQWQADGSAEAFLARYSTTCRSQPLVPPACPSVQLLLLWSTLRVLVFAYLPVLVSHFHDSYAAHRYPALVKAFPDPSAAQNVSGTTRKQG